ncbi:hypothetical protein QJN78_24770, partial [Escherichia coli]
KVLAYEVRMLMTDKLQLEDGTQLQFVGHQHTHFVREDFIKLLEARQNREVQQFNKVLAYEVRMLMTDKLQLEDGTQLQFVGHQHTHFVREDFIKLL